MVIPIPFFPEREKGDVIAVPQNPEILILLLPQREQILQRKIVFDLLREFTN